MFRPVSNFQSLEAILDMHLETIVDFYFSTFIGFLFNEFKSIIIQQYLLHLSRTPQQIVYVYFIFLIFAKSKQ